jgi:hypothetical protein
MTSVTTDRRLVDQVERLGAEHPPIDVASVDFTVRRPDLLLERFGRVLDYMARAELEVERNVLEPPTEAEGFTEQICRVERDLLWAQDRGLKVPPYVARAFGEAVEMAHTRRRAA